MSRTEPIYVLGVGALAAPGFGPDAIAAAWRDGWRLPPAPPELAVAGFADRPLGAIPDFDPARYLKLRGMRPLARASQLGCVAAGAALGFPAPLPFAGETLGVVLGTRRGSLEPLAEFDRSAALGGPHLVNPAQFPNVVVNAHAGYLGILFGLAGPNITLCGAGAGLEAVVHAVDLLELGRATAIVAGGSEALGVTLLHGQSRSGAPDRTDPPGEGAALLLLTQQPGPRPVLARIVGAASATAHTAAEAEAVRAALLGSVMAAKAPESIDTVWHAGAATKAFSAYGIEAERIRALAAIVGDCEAATGALAAVLAAAQVARVGGAVLATAFPTSGTQSVVLFE